MPITQSRMLNLIKAADAYASTLHSLTRFISDTASAIPPDAPSDTLLTALQNIQQFSALSTIPQDLLTLLAEEKAHFKLNATRNERHARRAKLKRQGLFTPQSLPPIPSPTTSKQMPLLSDIELARLGVDFGLTEQKLKMNEQHKEWGMPIPYPDVFDNSIPLSDEHKRHLKLPVESSDSDLF